MRMRTPLGQKPDMTLKKLREALGLDCSLVRFGAGGICGSDLHYYHEGEILDFKIREPLVLGHEVAGEVVEIGPGVSKVSVGHQVAVNPVRTCLRCVCFLSGRSNLCLVSQPPGFLGVQPGFRMFKHVCGIIHRLGKTVRNDP
jgi:threonine dehydrogenase-like Zn-dependent dehydrogenase